MEKYLLNILQASLFNFLIIGAALSMIFGLWLLIAPHNAQSFNKKINKTFSMRKSTKFLETPVSIERWFYRHAKMLGSLLMLGSCYLFYLLLWKLNFSQLTQALPHFNSLIWEWLLDAFLIFFTLVSISVFLIGFLIIIRPSLLKPLENKANKWVSTRNNMQFMSDDISQADQLLSRFPRQFGAIILLCSTIVLLNLDKFKF